MANPKLIDLSHQELMDRFDLAMCELAEEKEKTHILHQQVTDARREKFALGNRLAKASEKLDQLIYKLKLAEERTPDAFNKLGGKK